MSTAHRRGRPVVPADGADLFHWLEDGTSEDVHAWELERTAELSEHLDRDGLRETTREHLAPFMAAGGYGLPCRVGDKSIYLRFEPRRDHPVLVMADEVGAEADLSARVVFDPREHDPEGCDLLVDWSASPEGSRLAVVLAPADGGPARIELIDPWTGVPSAPPLEGCHPLAPVWLPDGSGLCYVRIGGDGSTPRRTAALHLLDRPDDPAHQIRGVPEDFLVQRVGIARSGHRLMVQARRGRATGVWLGVLDVTGGGTSVSAVHAASDCTASFRGDRLDVLTRHGAPRGRLLTLSLDGDRGWSETVPERPDEVLVQAVGTGDDDRLLTVWRARGASRVRIHRPDDEPGAGERVDLPGIGSVNDVRTDPDGRTWMVWTDFVTPPSLLRYTTGGAGAEPVLWAPGSAPRGSVSCERHEAVADDGVPVGVFVIGPADLPGPAPTLLTVYGGFGLAYTPTFSAAALAWTAAGGRWAMVGVRGGGEEGERWREAARGRAKYRSVRDLHAAADHLVDSGVAAAGHVGLLGSSHGGMLAAAAAVDRPDTYAGVIASAAPLDMLGFARWPAGRAWIPEYGDPEDPRDRAALAAYSPYHNLRRGTRYPPFLLTALELDGRVDPAHARKFCAALRICQDGTVEEPPGVALYALRSRLGHGSGTLSARKAQAVDEFCFLARALGLPLGERARSLTIDAAPGERSPRPAPGPRG